MSASQLCRPVLLAACLAALVQCCGAVPDAGGLQWRRIAPGVDFAQQLVGAGDPQITHVVRVRLKDSSAQLRPVQALERVCIDGEFNGREVLHRAAERSGALAAVNADFFPYTGDPLGIEVIDGELFSEPMANRACLCLTANRPTLEILAFKGVCRRPVHPSATLSGVNRLPTADETVLLTPRFRCPSSLPRPMTVVGIRFDSVTIHPGSEMRGEITEVRRLAAKAPLPVMPAQCAWLAIGANVTEYADAVAGEKIECRLDLVQSPMAQQARRPSEPATGSELRAAYRNDLDQAISGGPFLVRDGKPWIDGEAEGFSAESFINTRHPRTAVGIARNGDLLLVAVDGRSKLSSGMTLPELAEYMVRLGAVRAINLDGGGSTTMWLRAGVVNAPSDGRERPIANGLAVVGEAVQPLQSQSGAIAIEMEAGATVTISLPPGFSDGSTEEPLWGTEDGFGFVSQQGRFTAIRPGDVRIHARSGGRETVFAVHVRPQSPATTPVPER